MTKEYIDTQLETLKDELSENNKNPPVAKYIKENKHISVTYGFNCGFIPNVKIIAESKKWLKWYNDFEQVTFDKIEPYLSRPPKKTLKALKQYVKEDPKGFTGDMLKCVLLSLEENPLYPPRVKTRKPSKYNLTWTEKIEIANISIRLYDYLYKINKQKETEWPAYLKKFLIAHDSSKLNLQNPFDIKDVIRRVMSEYYGVKFAERFWQTFIIEGPILIKQVRKISPDPNPENDDFLKELFKGFM